MKVIMSCRTNNNYKLLGIKKEDDGKLRNSKII